MIDLYLVGTVAARCNGQCSCASGDRARADDLVREADAREFGFRRPEARARAPRLRGKEMRSLKCHLKT